MQYTEGRLGRIFVLRLESGDIIPQTIEKFAKEKGVQAGWVALLGGVDVDSKVISGPLTDKNKEGPVPLYINQLKGIHESLAVGTLFPNEVGDVILHLHLACGRNDATITGCGRLGVHVWTYMEVVIHEIIDSQAFRYQDSDTGFTLLRCENSSLEDHPDRSSQ